MATDVHRIPPPIATTETHSLLLSYVFWLVGFFGIHRFYLGRPLSGALWLFTGGLLGVGWLIDLLLIPDMCRQANARYRPGYVDYSICWLVFLLFLGVFGAHKFYMGRIVWGVIYFLTAGVFGFGLIYDLLTLNEQIEAANVRSAK